MTDPGSFIAQVSPETPDASAEPKPLEAKPEEGFATRFAHLAKKERELQKKAEEWKKERESYQTHLKELEELKKWKAQREEDPDDIGELLQSRGLNFEKVTDYFLQGGKPTPEALIAKAKKELEEKFDSFEKSRLEKEAKEAETKAQEQIATFKQQIAEFAGKNEFELIAATSGEELVFSVMEEHFQKTGKILDMKEACELVEDHLETQELEKLSKIKKLRTKLGLPLEQDPPERATSEGASETPSVPSTLTQRMTQAGSPKATSSKDREALTKEAAKHLRWI